MMRCKKCNQTTARITTKRELSKLSATFGPLTAAAATVATAATAKGAAGFALRAAKTAAKGPQAVLLGLAVTAATTAVTVGVKYLVSRRAAGEKNNVYCESCGHYEAMN